MCVNSMARRRAPPRATPRAPPRAPPPSPNRSANRPKTPSPNRSANRPKTPSPNRPANRPKTPSPNRPANKSPKSANRKPLTKTNVINTLGARSASGALVAVKVKEPKMKKILMSLVPKIQKLSLNGILAFVIIMTFNYSVLMNPRLPNNIIDDTLVAGKWPGRILYANRGKVVPEPGFKNKWLSMNSWVRWYKGPTPADLKLADAAMEGLMKSLPENKNKYGRSWIGLGATYSTYMLGIIMLILVYFPHKEKEAFETLVLIFKIIMKYAPTVYSILEKRILHELKIQTTVRTAPYTIALALCVEVYKCAKIAPTLGPKAYLENVAGRYLPTGTVGTATRLLTQAGRARRGERR